PLQLGLAEELFRIDRGRRRQPNPEPGLRMGPTHSFGQVLGQTELERVAALAVLGEHPSKVRAQIAALEKFGERVLQKRGGAKIQRVFERCKVCPQRTWTEQIANAQRGNQLLAVGP